MNKLNLVKRGLIRWGCVGVFAAGTVWAQPNILYINADDLGVMNVEYNNPKYHTPNIDKLRAEGMLFTEAHAAAANCAPSRASVMSGQYTPRHGVFTVGSSARGESCQRRLIPVENKRSLDLDNLTVAEALQAGGYKTLHLGKWHIGNDPLEQGFDASIGGDHSAIGGWFSPFKKGTMTGYNSQYPEGTHRADIYVDEAIKFMKKKDGKPFFINMDFYLVHSPLHAVPEYIEKYKNVEGINPEYASMVEKLDACVGRLLAGVDDLGLKNETMVLFCSDNGGICATSRQTPYRAGKGSYFEGGTRIPLIVRWPGTVASNSTCNVPVIGVDYYPTFLDVAGLAKPEGKILDGVSLLPLLTQSGTLPERTLFWHFPIYLQAYAGLGDDSHDIYFRTRPGSTLLQGKWKLHEYFENGDVELYDLSTDVGERNNLAATHPEKTAELLELLKQWRVQLGAPVPTELNPEYDPDAGSTEKKAPKKKKKKKKKKGAES